MAFDFASSAQTLKDFSILLSIVMASYAGFKLMTDHEIQQRGEWKEMLAGIGVGLVLLFLARTAHNVVIPLKPKSVCRMRRRNLGKTGR